MVGGGGGRGRKAALGQQLHDAAVLLLHGPLAPHVGLQQGRLHPAHVGLPVRPVQLRALPAQRPVISAGMSIGAACGGSGDGHGWGCAGERLCFQQGGTAVLALGGAGT